MKQLIILSVLMFYHSFSLLAQIHTPIRMTKTKVIDTSKNQTLKIKPENTILQKLPDLKIVSFTVSYMVGSGIIINYTIKNEGTAPVAKGSVGLQGLIGFGPTDTRPFAGCGTTLGLSYQFLNPGESESGSYQCTNINKSPNLYYTLILDYNNEVKELNENNNKAQTTIL